MGQVCVRITATAGLRLLLPMLPMLPMLCLLIWNMTDSIGTVDYQWLFALLPHIRFVGRFRKFAVFIRPRTTYAVHLFSEIIKLVVFENVRISIQFVYYYFFVELLMV